MLPRRFETNPVVGVSCELGEDREHVRLLETAQRVFSDILQEARERCLSAAASREFATRGIWWAPRESFHAVVSVFSEHPDLLDRDARERWTPVPEDKLKHELGVELRSDLWAYPVPPINLRLHGYRCVDGAPSRASWTPTRTAGTANPEEPRKKKRAGGGRRRRRRRRARRVRRLRRRASKRAETLGALSSRPAHHPRHARARAAAPRRADGRRAERSAARAPAPRRREAARDRDGGFSRRLRAPSPRVAHRRRGRALEERIVAPGIGGALRVREVPHRGEEVEDEQRRPRRSRWRKTSDEGRTKVLTPRRLFAGDDVAVAYSN